MATFTTKKNNAHSTLSVSHVSGDGLIVIQSGEQSRFPGTFPSKITVWFDGNDQITGTIFTVTSATANTFHVTVAADESPTSVDQNFDITNGTVNVACEWTYGAAHEYETAINALDKLTTNGDLLYYNSAAYQRLPIGTTGQILSVVSGVAAWTTLGAVRVTKSGAQTLTTGVDTALTFNQEDYKTVTGMHSTSVNTSRLIAPVAGIYMLDGGGRWGTESAAGLTSVTFKVNGTSNIFTNTHTGTTGYNDCLGISTPYKLSANDYVEIIANQTSGGDKTITSAFTYFSMTLIQAD